MMNSKEFYQWLSSSTGDIEMDIDLLEAYIKTDDFAKLHSTRKNLVFNYRIYLISIS
jgi:hypothetical protein